MKEDPFRQGSKGLFNYHPDAVIAVDTAGTICVFNERAQRLFGYKPEEVLDQKIEILVPEQDKKVHVTYRQSYLKDPTDFCIGEVREVTALHKSGKEFPVDVTLSPQLIDDEQFVFAAARDATQRVQLKNRLNESEQRYRLVVDNSKDVIFRTNEAGEWTFLNPAWTEITGFKIEESIGQPFSDFVHPEDRDRHMAFFLDIIDKVTEYCRDEFRYLVNLFGSLEEFRIRDSDDSFRWVEVHCRGLVDETTGMVIGTTGVVRDITRRKQAEQAVRESERRFHLLVEQAPDAFYLHDLDGNIIDVNQQTCVSLGYSREELLKLNVTEIEEKTDPQTLRTDWKAHELDRPYTMEGINRRKDGTLFPVEIHNRRFKSGDHDLILALVRDVTQRKQSEQELERLDKHVRLLLESAGEGIFGVNDTGHCTFINAAALEILGYSYAEFNNIAVHQSIHHTRTDGSPYTIEECPIYQSYHDGERRHVENEVLWRKDGTSFPADYSSYPIVEDGKTTGAVIVFRNVAEARAMSHKMDFLAKHDSLTGLINRREFEFRLDNTLRNAHKEGAEHVLCYLDLDQFKVVNDTCGHVAGDELLRQLSTLLHTKIRHRDTLARLGGDEFGVLLEHCSLKQALLIIDELKRTVQEFRFTWADTTFVIGVSIGVVTINRDTESVATALSSADAACYIAKDKGRNRIHIYQADDAEVTQRHGEMQWVAKIHDAFEQSRFYLAYQPIISTEMSDTQQSHFEFLIRMRDSAGNTVPPGSFIPAAERYNIMPTIDRWVIRSAFSWLENNPDLLEKVDFCCINLSGHSFSDELFLEFVTEQFQQTSVAPEKICFEITETAAVANLTGAIHFMESLKRSGFRFALDDFGSGMSSFAYLKNLPVDFLKIDGNFIRDIVHDPVDRAMVEAINQVGHVMGLQTIAEFVENDAILEQLRHIGVDYAQGFGIAKPQSLQDFTLG